MIARMSHPASTTDIASDDAAGFEPSRRTIVPVLIGILAATNVVSVVLSLMG